MYSLTEATDREIVKLLKMNKLKGKMRIKDIKKYLIKNKFRKLGEGAYSSVYHKQGYKRVVKISEHYFGDETSWSHYAKYCKKNSRKNPHLLKVYYIDEYGGEGSPPYYVAVTERLYDLDLYIRKVSEQDLTDIILRSYKNYGSDYTEDEKHDMVFYNHATILEEIARRNDIKIDYATHAEDPYEALRFVLKNGKKGALYKTLDNIAAKFGLYEEELDIHMDNFMVRKTKNRVIITDPMRG